MNKLFGHGHFYLFVLGFTAQSTLFSTHTVPGQAYRKNPKISDTRKFAVITLKIEQDGFSLE